MYWITFVWLINMEICISVATKILQMQHREWLLNCNDRSNKMAVKILITRFLYGDLNVWLPLTQHMVVESSNLRNWIITNGGRIHLAVFVTPFFLFLNGNRGIDVLFIVNRSHPVLHNYHF